MLWLTSRGPNIVRECPHKSSTGPQARAGRAVAKRFREIWNRGRESRPRREATVERSSGHGIREASLWPRRRWFRPFLTWEKKFIFRDFWATEKRFAQNRTLIESCWSDIIIRACNAQIRLLLLSLSLSLSRYNAAICLISSQCLSFTQFHHFERLCKRWLIVSLQSLDL